jgi:Tfp pilus assembly protein PilF
LATLASALILIYSSVDLHRLAAYHDAITLWEDTIGTNPDDGVAHNNLGHELSKTNRFQKASEQFRIALEINPEDAAAHGNLGLMLMETNELKSAIEQFKEAIRLDADYIDASSNLGVALMRLDQTQEAIAQFRETLRKDPYSAITHENLGIALGNSGQIPEALEQFQIASQMNPLDPNVYLYLMLSDTQMNRPAEALAAANKGLESARSQGQQDVARKIEAWLQENQSDKAK